MTHEELAWLEVIMSRLTHEEAGRLAIIVSKMLVERKELHDALYAPPTTDPEVSKQQALRHWEAYHAIAR